MIAIACAIVVLGLSFAFTSDRLQSGSVTPRAVLLADDSARAEARNQEVHAPVTLNQAASLPGPALPVAAAEPSGISAPTEPTPQSGSVAVKLLAINDLHGGLSTGQVINGRAVGGAAYLAAHLKARAATSAHPFLLSVGDMFGASAPVSGLLREEPTIRALNAMGLQLNTPANHEFDRGLDEMLRLTEGRCRAEDDCFEGARFPETSANIMSTETGLPFFPAYHLEIIEGVPVAFIGATHVDVAAFTKDGAVDGLYFLPPAAAINIQVRALQEQGVHAFVAMVHEGGWIDPNSGQLVGPIASIVEALDPEVAVVLTAHTHQSYTLRHAGRLVTQGFADGLAFVDADLVIDRETRRITEATAQVVTTYDDLVSPDPAVEAVVHAAEERIHARTDRPIGISRRELSKVEQNAAGETPLGDLIADGQRWSTTADIGLVNLFSIRGSIPEGPVTWGDLYSVQAFANQLVTMTLTGDQLYQLFDEQWTVDESGSEVYRPLQVAGLRVRWQASRPRGQRISALTLPDGRPIVRTERYTVVVNDFLARGGDDLSVLRDGTDREQRSLDVDALADYLATLSQPFDARMEGRIVRID